MWNSIPHYIMWNSIPHYFIWNSIPHSLIWNSIPHSFMWNSIPHSFMWNSTRQRIHGKYRCPHKIQSSEVVNRVLAPRMSSDNINSNVSDEDNSTNQRCNDKSQGKDTHNNTNGEIMVNCNNSGRDNSRNETSKDKSQGEDIHNNTNGEVTELNREDLNENSDDSVMSGYRGFHPTSPAYRTGEEPHSPFSYTDEEGSDDDDNTGVKKKIITYYWSKEGLLKKSKLDIAKNWEPEGAILKSWLVLPGNPGYDVSKGKKWREDPAIGIDV